MSKAINLKTMYEGGVAQLWFEEKGFEPDLESPEFIAYKEKKLAPIKFADRKDWHENLGLESELTSAMTRQIQRFAQDKIK